MPSVLDSFDPFATHPFTNNSCPPPRAPPPSHYSHKTTPPPLPTYPNNNSYVSKPSSPKKIPSKSGKAKSPSPSRHTPGSPKSTDSEPIFVPFKQQRSCTPDLDELLTKKGSSPNKGNALGSWRP